nr:outer-membrane lipoprotein carrier protein LolA [Hankyongella ginsenosidimutans]
MTLARPGKVRFQYEPTVPFLVVADGRQVSLVDYEVAQVQRYPIRETPLASLLGSADGLRQYAQTIRVADQSGIEILTVEAQDKRRPEYGRLTLYFQDAPGHPPACCPSAGPLSTTRDRRRRCN